MPSHHPASSFAERFSRSRRERERIVDEFCDRLSAGLGSAVLALEELVESRAVRPGRVGPGPATANPGPGAA